ncbi:MAG: iron-containing alcohol dehydrogenase [Gammaproteobacteria bacterium]|nr:iron-containing alcohol dehydrogenase [Gammaproteobacteria bacterium]MDH3858008.1 iron-containing alcohol dehydrogenase [Gammaproteobacteria bacterium]
MGCQYFAPCDHGADTFTIAIPKLTFGRGCLREAGARAAGLGMTRVGLFTDPYLRESAYVATVLESLGQAGLDVAVFDEITIEADDASVERGAAFFAEGGFDGVVSVGGGSVMDTAKASMLYALDPPDEFLDYFAPPLGAGRPMPRKLLPHLACATTSGTGSECTSISVLRISDLATKFVLANRVLLPQEALVDPACSDTLPAMVVASTGFDLLCHALECYTAKAYTRWDRMDDPLKRPPIQGANPWSDLAARKALEIAGEYLERGVNNAEDHEARDQLMWGASLAGMAFGNTGTHLGHALSYGVTHLMHDVTTDGYPVKSPFVPHGISVVVSAPAIFRYTAEAAPERHFEAAGYLQSDLQGAGVDDSGAALAKRIIGLMRKTGVPNGLSGVGFGPADVPALAASTARQVRAIANSPRETNLVDIENIYAAAMSY